jgi:hypothetical protein
MAYRNIISPAVLFIAFLAAGTAFWGCHGAGTGALDKDTYRVDGTLILDRNPDSSLVVVSLERNDSTLTNGTVRFAGNPLGFFATVLPVDSVYFLRLKPAALWADDEQYLYIADGSSYRDSAVFSVPDTFSITQNFSPPNHLVRGGEQVAFEWTPAANAAGYVIATVKQSKAYQGKGYSAYAATGVTAATIPPDAFINDTSLTLDTGLYNIYVYAFAGSPDSALCIPYLPVPFPAQLDDNVAIKNAVGRFGAISVIRHDTVRVAEQ